MDGKIGLIRELASEIATQFTGYADHHEAKGAVDKSLTNLRYRNKTLEIIDTITALETEIAALRQNALDLTKVPDGATWRLFSIPDGNIMAEVGWPNKVRDAISDSPAAAFNAACERAREVK